MPKVPRQKAPPLKPLKEGVPSDRTGEQTPPPDNALDIEDFGQRNQTHDGEADVALIIKENNRRRVFAQHGIEPPPDPYPSPLEEDKPPPEEGGWGYTAARGWGYFPPQDEPLKRKKR
jgi:hypothetical protein